MKVLVTYASRYGATKEIAERIAEFIEGVGVGVDVRPVSDGIQVEEYDAVVIGSAVYFGKWMKEATEFVTKNAQALQTRHVWLFSSGPLGTSQVDAEGKDLRAAAEPDELPALRAAAFPQDHRVFFGAVDPKKLGMRDRLLRTLPAARAAIPEGDFRDWENVEAYAAEIARELTFRTEPLHAH